MERQANNTMGSSGTETAILWYIYWGNILYETGKKEMLIIGILKTETAQKLYGFYGNSRKTLQSLQNSKNTFISHTYTVLLAMKDTGNICKVAIAVPIYTCHGTYIFVDRFLVRKK